MKTKNTKVLGMYRNGKRFAQMRTCEDAANGEVLYYYCVPESRVYISTSEFTKNWVKV